MRLGIALPAEEAGGRPLRAESLADAARRIEAAGFQSAWAFDAIGRGFLLPDPLTALAVAATATRDIELGTGVLQVLLRSPVELARRVLTTQLVCRGRLPTLPARHDPGGEAGLDRRHASRASTSSSPRATAPCRRRSATPGPPSATA